MFVLEGVLNFEIDGDGVTRTAELVTEDHEVSIVIRSIDYYADHVTIRGLEGKRVRLKIEVIN